jgi:hypothetical protein
MSLDADIGRLGSLIRQLQGALGGRTVRGGAGTVTFPGASVSNVATVTHGLGRTPAQVFIQGSGNGFRFSADITALNGTTFSFVAEAVDGGAKGPGGATFNWLVLG